MAEGVRFISAVLALTLRAALRAVLIACPWRLIELADLNVSSHLTLPDKDHRHKKSPTILGLYYYGGGREIRTHGRLQTYAGFQDQCIQPLCQPSVNKLR